MKHYDRAAALVGEWERKWPNDLEDTAIEVLKRMIEQALTIVGGKPAESDQE